MLGEMSFTIFLTHQLVLRYATKLSDYFQVNNGIIYILATLTATIVVSYILDRHILKPITQWLTKKIQLSMIARS